MQFPFPADQDEGPLVENISRDTMWMPAASDCVHSASGWPCLCRFPSCCYLCMNTPQGWWPNSSCWCTAQLAHSLVQRCTLQISQELSWVALISRYLMHRHICTNGCLCWPPDLTASPVVGLESLCRPSPHAVIQLRHKLFQYLSPKPLPYSLPVWLGVHKESCTDPHMRLSLAPAADTAEARAPVSRHLTPSGSLRWFPSAPLCVWI